VTHSAARSRRNRSATGFRASKAGIFGAALLTLLMAASLLAPLILRYNPLAQDFPALLPPSFAHLVNRRLTIR